MAIEPIRKKRSDRRQIRVSDRLAKLESGELTVDDLDDEEILRGQLRDKNGAFTGRPPKWIPQEFAIALARRQQAVIQQQLLEMVPSARKALLDVMQKKNAVPGDGAKVQAAKLVLEYVHGKVPDKVEIKAEVQTWERHAEEIIIDVVEEDDADEAE